MRFCKLDASRWAQTITARPAGHSLFIHFACRRLMLLCPSSSRLRCNRPQAATPCTFVESSICSTCPVGSPPDHGLKWERARPRIKMASSLRARMFWCAALLPALTRQPKGLHVVIVADLASSFCRPRARPLEYIECTSSKTLLASTPSRPTQGTTPLG